MTTKTKMMKMPGPKLQKGNTFYCHTFWKIMEGKLYSTPNRSNKAKAIGLNMN